MDFFSICKEKGIGYATYLAQNKAGMPLLVYESEGIEEARTYARRVVCGRADVLMDLAVYLHEKYDTFPEGFRFKRWVSKSKKFPIWKGGALFYSVPLKEIKIFGDYAETDLGKSHSCLLIKEADMSNWRILDITGMKIPPSCK
jgi:hypothetical protein